MHHFSTQWTPDCSELPVALNPDSLKLRDCSGGNVAAWSVQHVVSWLEELDLSAEVQAAFKKAEVDGEMLLELKAETIHNTLGLTDQSVVDTILEGLLVLQAQVNGPMLAKEDDGTVKVLPQKELPARKTPPPLNAPPAKPVLKKPDAMPAPEMDLDNLPPSPVPGGHLSVEQQANTASESHPKAPPALPPADKTMSILKGTHMRPANKRVTFDEEALAATKHMLAVFRGIHARVDWVACDSGYYLGQVPKEQAVERLRGAPQGCFVIFDSLACKETLFVSYVSAEGTLVHTQIKNSPKGLYLKGTKEVYFETLHEMVQYYAGPNPVMPNIFYLPPEDTGYLDDVEDGDGDGGDGEVDTGPLSASWYHAGINRQQAMHMIEFEPTGSFVVRDCDVGGYVITYVQNGRIHHAQVSLTEAGWAVQGSEEAFASMHALIDAYTKDDSPGDLKCMLRMPKGSAGAAGGKTNATNMIETHEQLAKADLESRKKEKAEYMASNPVYVRARMPGKPGATPPEEEDGIPSWLKLGVSKREALQCISDKTDGAFVIRSSESRPNTFVLSYVFQKMIQNEVIIPVEGAVPGMCLESTPGRNFENFRELVAYYSEPRSELKFPLTTNAHFKGDELVASDANLATLHSHAPPAPNKMQRSGSRAALTKQPSQKSLASSGPSDTGPPRPGLKRGQSTQSINKPKLSRGQSTQSIRSTTTSVNPNKPTLGRGTSAISLGTPEHVAQNITEAVHNLTHTRVDERAKGANWFCLGLSKEEAISRLPRKEGAFIIRASNEHFAMISMVAK